MGHKLIFLCVLLAVGMAAAFPSRQRDPEENPDLFEGDLIIDEKLRNGQIDLKYRWPNATLVYEMDVDFTLDETARILTGLAEIERVSCVRFRKRTDDDEDYVFVQKAGSGCYSSVGRVGGQQILNLQAGSCITRHGTVIHEFLHSLGFWHTQSSPDRDDYVTIVWDKIEPGKEHNFNKHDYVEATTFNAPYDYASVLHYSAGGFSIDGSPTIVPKIPGIEFGQRLNISSIDAGKLRIMYDCPQ